MAKSLSEGFSGEPGGYAFESGRAELGKTPQWDRMPPMGEYDTAQICTNGHVINECAATLPLHNSPYCSKCGAETIMSCQHCQARILGSYHSPGVLSFGGMMTAPAFCRNCGKAFPWTATRIETARLLADETDSFSSTEREELKLTFDDLVRDTPKTTLATSRFKKFMSKTGKETAQAFRDILVDVVSESVKKSIWGP